MFKKRWLLMLVVLFIPCLLLGCELFAETELELSDDFFGLGFEAEWVYDETEFFVDEGFQFSATRTKTVRDVVDVQVQSENQLFYVEIAWQYADEGWEPSSYGRIIERDNNAYYRAGFWEYDNGDIISDLFEEGEFWIEQGMAVGDLGFWNFELLSKTESVTVPAGVFEAWHFKRFSQFEVAREIEQKWFVPYIGIVKEEYRQEWKENDDTWVTLEGYQIKLVDFNP